MRHSDKSPLYRASRFYVGSNPRRRRLWTRSQTAPAEVAGYALLAGFLATVGLVAVTLVSRFSHEGIRHMLQHAAAFLQNLNQH